VNDKLATVVVEPVPVPDWTIGLPARAGLASNGTRIAAIANIEATCNVAAIFRDNFTLSQPFRSIPPKPPLTHDAMPRAHGVYS
jgi:hypothetical protein